MVVVYAIPFTTLLVYWVYFLDFSLDNFTDPPLSRLSLRRTCASDRTEMNRETSEYDLRLIWKWCITKKDWANKQQSSRSLHMYVYIYMICDNTNDNIDTYCSFQRDSKLERFLTIIYNISKYIFCAPKVNLWFGWVLLVGTMVFHFTIPIFCWGPGVGELRWSPNMQRHGTTPIVNPRSIQSPYYWWFHPHKNPMKSHLP